MRIYISILQIEYIWLTVQGCRAPCGANGLVPSPRIVGEVLTLAGTWRVTVT